MKDQLDELDPDSAPEALLGALQTAYQTVHWAWHSCIVREHWAWHSCTVRESISAAVSEAVVAQCAALHAPSQLSQLSQLRDRACG